MCFVELLRMALFTSTQTQSIVWLLIATFFFFFLFRAAPMAYGNSQARGRIGAAAAGLDHSHRNVRSDPHL